MTADVDSIEPIEPIELTIYTSAGPTAAWAGLTDPAIVAEWFADATPVGPVGSPYRLDFGDGSVVEGVIIALEPGRRFGHTWAWAADDAIGPTTVTWTVGGGPHDGPDGGSRIDLVHAGWSEAGADVAARDEHRSYWETYLGELVMLLDAG